jgi:hypothetical protein
MTVVEQGRRRGRDGLAFPRKPGINLHARGAGKSSQSPNNDFHGWPGGIDLFGAELGHSAGEYGLRIKSANWWQIGCVCPHTSSPASMAGSFLFESDLGGEYT